MNDNIKALELALANVRTRLLSANVTEPGFGEIRSLYNDLSNSLIRTAHKRDDEVATQLNATAHEIAEEWESSKAALGNWTDALKDVVQGVGGVLALAGLPNPLAKLLSSP